MHRERERVRESDTGVFEKTLLRTVTPGQMSFQSVKSEVGKQLLLLHCGAKARPKGMFVHRYRYVYPCGLSADALNEHSL